jgi:cyclic pyranopterin monophosphate synthase
MSGLSHIDETGAARMVDVGAKPATPRSATARGTIRMNATALAAIRDGSGPKGDVLATARVAGIMAAKKTADLIPLCHPLALDAVTVDSVALLTIYDMAKALDKAMVLSGICLVRKTGGKSGEWRRED